MCASWWHWCLSDGLLWSLLIFGLPFSKTVETPECGLTGVYKTRQNLIESPNYPDHYPTSTCWDYVVRSPYRCPTKFHIQFLDFFLEYSENCTKDYLAIGLENNAEDMDVLCGQVVGIKKYYTPDGVLRLRFYSDDSPWSTGKGFKLLVTRLPCEQDDTIHDELSATDEDSTIKSPVLNLQPPSTRAPLDFHRTSWEEQHKPYDLPPLIDAAPAEPTQFSLGGVALPGTEKPCMPEDNGGSLSSLASRVVPTQTISAPIPTNDFPATHVSNFPQLSVAASPLTPLLSLQPLQYFGLQDPQQQQQQKLPTLLNQYPINTWTTLDTSPRIPFIGNQFNNPFINNWLPQIKPIQSQCCLSPFRQQRFYLSSPGFPKTVFTSLLPTEQRDCQFQLEKFTPNVCRWRIEFKFYDFGQSYSGTGTNQGNIDTAIGTSRDVCTEDFLEIDGERFCGCRTGYIHSSYWGLGRKEIRMRIGYSGLPSSGFLLDIQQVECQPTPFANRNVQNLGFNYPQQQQSTPGFAGTNYNFFLQPQPQQQQQPPSLTQQQLPLYPAVPFHQREQSFLQQPPFVQQRPPWVPSLRQARAIEIAKSDILTPHSVRASNSTRREFYFADGDEAFARARQDFIGQPLEPDDPNRYYSRAHRITPRQRCTFDTQDILVLSTDTLWLNKPICYAPQRRLFGSGPV